MWAIMKMYEFESLEVYSPITGEPIKINLGDIEKQGLIGFMPIFATREDAIMFDGGDANITRIEMTEGD